MMQELKPRDFAEEVALFRAQVIGTLTCRSLSHGELQDALRTLSRTVFRPPRAERTRTYSIPTLERWYYRFQDRKSVV